MSFVSIPFVLSLSIISFGKARLFLMIVCSYCILASEEFLELVKSALQAALEGEFKFVGLIFC